MHPILFYHPMTVLALASTRRYLVGALADHSNPRRSFQTAAAAARRRSGIGRATGVTNNHRRIQRSPSTASSSSSFAATTSSGDHPPAEPDSSSERRTEYEQLVRKLYMTNLFHPVKLGLENMDALHEALGRPMDQPNLSVIHIAGSNGKGSVALKTAHTLQKSHHSKVGLFVSPHISSFRERIQINGAPVSEERVVRYLGEIFDLCESKRIPATFFEITTALAFRIFAAENVDAVVLETGLGGRLDATNVIRRPAVCVITSIGLEHTRILGDTAEQIAREKGGIIKGGCSVLIGPSVPFDVIKEIADEKSAEVFRCEDFLGVDTADTTTSADGIMDYDAENSRMAKAALIMLQFHLARKSIERGERTRVMITPREMEEGVKIRPPCRFEEMDIAVVDDDPIDGKSKTVRVILDVAHNPQAIQYLIGKLIKSYPNLDPEKNIRMVVGMSADKDLKQCTDTLLNYVKGDASKIHLVAASHPRAASIDKILEANPSLNGAHYCHDGRDDEPESSSVTIQVREALNLAAANTELLIICGSVFIMADAREELGIVEPRDSAVIAEVAGAGLRSSQENFDDEKK